MTPRVEPQRDVELQGHYAGMVSRFCGFLLDSFFAGVLYSVLMALGLAALSVVTGQSISLQDHRWFALSTWVVWYFLYFAGSLATSGRTPAMGLLGIECVRADGAELGPRRAFIRMLVFPISFLFFGIGFILGLLDRDRRCLHDRIAGVVLVYSWDARTAKARLLPVRHTGAPPA